MRDNPINVALIDIGNIQQRTAYIPSIEVEVKVLHTTQGPFFVIREICGILGLSDVYQQTQRLKEHAVLSRFVCSLPVKTDTRGRHAAMCIHRRGLGWWWGGLNLNKVREEVRDVLLELQEDIVAASERAMFGETASLDGIQEFCLMLERLNIRNRQDIDEIKRFLSMAIDDDEE